MQIEMRKKENWIGNIVPKNEMERERETRLQVFVFHHFTLEQQEQQR